MIKEYVITYDKIETNGRYVTTTECQIHIPALSLIDAVDYAHRTLELDGIKEVRLA